MQCNNEVVSTNTVYSLGDHGERPQDDSKMDMEQMSDVCITDACVEIGKCPNVDVNAVKFINMTIHSGGRL